MGQVGDKIRQLLEKRRNKRHPYEVLIRYDYHQKAFQDYIRDISRGGTYIRTKSQIIVGHRIVLAIPLEGIDCEVRFIGEIARKDEDGIGVRFVDIRPEDETAIGRFIDRL